MHISRRGFLAATALVPSGLALAACGANTPATVVTVTQTFLNAAASIEAGFSGIKGLIPAASQEAISKYITEAETVLGGLVPGTLVPLTSIQNIAKDAEAAQQVAAIALPGNPIVEAIGVALPILAALAQISLPAGAAASKMSPDGAIDQLHRMRPYAGAILAKF